jgi:hypothetical protein
MDDIRQPNQRMRAAICGAFNERHAPPDPLRSLPHAEQQQRSSNVHSMPTMTIGKSSSGRVAKKR